jgi:glycosyltransferase involved in cell wall biosynthesis
MRVLYLFNGSREGLLDKVRAGEEHGNGFWGMIGLREHGIEADYIELEQFFPKSISRFLRKHLNIYFIHVPLFWKIFSYDIVFTSASFGLQFFHMLFGIRRPIWIMHDFSIKGLLGDEKTPRQRLFRSMVLRSKGVVTLSQDEKTFLEERFPHLQGRVECIPFGIDLDFFKKKDGVEKRQILSVGRDPDRDWKTFIEATRDIDVPIVITSWFARLEPLMPLPAKYQVLELTSRALVEKYTESSIVVIPLNTSYRNNDAMGSSALFEAMSMGKAIVATRTKAMESHVKDGVNGLLVPEGDVRAMRDAIERLLNDSALRKTLGENAYQYALENLDTKKCTARLADFFKNLLIYS